MIPIFILVIFFANNHELFSKKSIYYEEFIQSNRMGQLLEENLGGYSFRVNSGRSRIGIVTEPADESVFGVGSGLRMVPLLTMFAGLKVIFGLFWDRIYLIIAVLLPFVSFYLGWKDFVAKEDRNYLLLGAVIYGFNPLGAARIDGGYWPAVFAYALLAPFVAYTLKLFLQPSARHAVIVALFCWLLFVILPHFLVMGILATTLLLLPRLEEINWPKIIKPLLLSISLSAFLAGYQLLPSLLYQPFSIDKSSSFFSIALLDRLDAQSFLVNSIRLTEQLLPGYPSFAEIITYYFGFFYLLMALLPALLLLVFKRNVGWLWGVLITFVIFTFLAKGLNPPVAAFSQWLYVHIPPLHFFRDPTKFYAGIALATALSAILLLPKLKGVLPRSALLGSAILALWLGLSNYSATAQKLSLVKLPTSYTALQNLKTDGRIWYMPDNSGLQIYPWFDGKRGTINANPVEGLFPTDAGLTNFSGVLDTYNSQLMYVMKTRLEKGEITAKSIRRAGVSDIVIATDITDQSLKSSLGNIQQELAAYKEPDLSPNLWRANLATNSSSLHPTQPVFVTGNLNDYFAYSETQPQDKVLISLNQPLNAERFFEQAWNFPILLPNDPGRRQTEIQDVVLSSFNGSSLPLFRPLENKREGWSYSYDQADTLLNRGNNLLASKVYNSQKLGESMTLPSINCSAACSLAVRYASLGDNTDISVQVAGQTTQLAHSDFLRWELITLSKGNNDSIKLIHTGSNPSGRAIIETVLVANNDQVAARADQLRAYYNQHSSETLSPQAEDWRFEPLSYDTYLRSGQNTPVFIANYGFTLFRGQRNSSVSYLPDRLIFGLEAMTALIILACLTYLLRAKPKRTS